MTYLLFRALEHSIFYILIAAVPYVLYHWTGKLFLASVGFTALTTYVACWVTFQMETTLSVTLVTVLGVAVISVTALGLLLNARSAFSWAVVTFALELAFVRAATVGNPLTRGEEGFVSPFWSPTGNGWLVGLVLVTTWLVLFEVARRQGLFTWARLLREAPNLTRSLGIRAWRVRLPVYVFAGLTIGLATIHHMTITQRIQPAGFALCNSLVGFAVAFLAPARSLWPLFLFGLLFVGARICTALLGLPDATQLAEVVSGITIAAVVLLGARRHLWYGAED